MVENDGGLKKFRDDIVSFFCGKFNNVTKDSGNKMFVAVTRKGYWLYKNVEEEVLEKLESDSSDKIRIYSDRYILKDLDFKSIQGRKVILFDDSVNNGNNLFFFYTLFLKHGAVEVMPVVYAMSTEYISNMDPGSQTCPENKYLEYKRVYRKELEQGTSEAELRKEAWKKYRAFNKSLEYQKIMTASEMSKFSLKQLLLAQDCLSPFVMDLPMLRNEKQSVSKYKCITFSNREWEAVTEKTKSWEYIPNTYSELSEEINCDYFRLYDRLLNEQFENTFFDFVVKCKHKEEGENIKAVFVPFAIVKSYAYEDVWQCFSIMFAGTEYFSHIQEFIDEKCGTAKSEPLETRAVAYMRKNHNLGRAIMRAVIYFVSMYIGHVFREMIWKLTGKELILDEDIMDDHNIEQFNDTVKKIWSEFDREQFEESLLQCQKTRPIEPINSEIVTERKKKSAEPYDVEQYIHFRAIDTKYKMTSMRDRLLTIETIEEEVDSHFLFESFNDRKAAITRAILLLLETSCIGNELLLDNEKDVIYRGFRAGETSEILFRKTFFLVYAYAYALYYLEGVQGYKENIGMIMDCIEQFFEQEGYMGAIVNEKEFQMYKHYFISMKNPHEQIPSKNYLIDIYANGVKKYGGQIFVEQAVDAVQYWCR